MKHPEFSFYSENLRYTYFTDSINGYIYWAIQKLAQKDVRQIDAYNISNILSQNKYTAQQAETKITIDILNEIISTAEYIARDTVEEYLILTESVVNCAMRRETYRKLVECERLCFNASETDLEQKIYTTLDNVMMDFSTLTKIPPFSEEVDRLWEEITQRQQAGMTGIPFKFPSLNEYVTIERGELVVFGAEQKQGKSILLLNHAIDLLRQGYAVLYIDSELNSRIFLMRMLSHLTGIEFSRLRSGRYTPEENRRIGQAKEWIKKRRITHVYLPMFDAQSIFTITKKVKHTQGLDVLIVDYFKGNTDGDAFALYAELGKLVDMVKNKIAGDMDIAAIGAAQATSTGKLADSAKIARNASTIIMIQDKTLEEIERDGQNCGNKKMRVVFNRNGAQMMPNEYIDLRFNGNRILYEEADRHAATEPY
ncbi:MAG: hypothetical protein NC084_04135 [Bacteroides sp.]|nr:hypothetical protein [Eubacterium sp.]MCM1417645.1 hypothetical protein [Roseburia sp.]MCM1461890.1 hypothetical protein [Bacteroides sp.]